MGVEWSNLVDSDPKLKKFDWVKLKVYKPAKQTRGKATAAHYVFDCQEEKNNVVTIDEIDLGDIQDCKEGLNLFCLFVSDGVIVILSQHS